VALINFLQLADALDYGGVAVQNVWQAEDDQSGQIVTMYFDIGTSSSDVQSQMGDADVAASPPPDPIQATEPKWQYNTETKEYCVFGDDGLKLFAIKRDVNGNAAITMFDAAGSQVLSPPSCRVFTTAGQSIAHSSWKDVNWENETYDVQGMHDAATNNSRITILNGEAGKYLVTASLSFVGNGTGTRGIRIQKNGAGQERRVMGLRPFATMFCTVTVSDFFDLAAGDYLEIAAWQNSGAALALQGSSDTNHFSVTKLR